MRASVVSFCAGSAAILGSVVIGCGDSGGSGGGGNDPVGPELRPGDVCSEVQPNLVRVRFSPAQVHLPICTSEPCTERTVRVVVGPDYCVDTDVTLTSSDPALAVPSKGTIGLYRSEFSLTLKGTPTPGRFAVSASVPTGAGEATAQLDVVVGSDAVPACGGTQEEPSLAGGDTLVGEGDLKGASIGLPLGADDEEHGSFLWRVEPFNARISCGSMELPAGHRALGPAITFGPEALAFKRDVPMSIPINPALFPSAARLRHLRVLYSGPKFKAPRVVPVADAHIEERDGAWLLSFKAPRLGTYQAIVDEAAGTRTFTRRITHRAVVGVSMGGMGTSMFGFRNHDRFDVIAPLGGPATWSWLIHNMQENHMGGFPEIEPGTTLADLALEKQECTEESQCSEEQSCIGVTESGPGGCTLMPTPVDPYEHPQTYNNWWAEYPRNGTGGAFPRRDYAQIFRDLSLLMGNPNGDNLSPGGENLPPGIPPDDPSVIGDHPLGECSVWVDPIDGSADHDVQVERASTCPAERCSHTTTLVNYYDREFNPDGTFPVITFCDGTGPTEAESPWANAWKASGNNDYPFEVALAVDYNQNGVRDEMEPIIQSGSEPWSDTGTDGRFSEDEPGYEPGVNEDPEGDDYQIQYNPGGTERDYRYQPGEPYEDVGMDGVANTPQQPAGGYRKTGDGYDVGEGDGAFTASRGLRRMWAYDPAAMIREQESDLPGGPLDDDALSRLDVWTDGGLRDIFNFHIAAGTLSGALTARGRDAAYFTDFAQLPGSDPSMPNQYTSSTLPWEDLPGSVFMRYGKLDPQPADIETGSGQHVGTVNEITFRLQSAIYFIGSRWTQPELRTKVLTSQDSPAPGAPSCEVDGLCTFQFTDSRGRTGPVTVNFPPGYAHSEQQDRRYPVIYMLHGYGQTPEDLGAAIIFINNWMNNPAEGQSDRLSKAILVYVDGRCRSTDGEAECLRGNFFVDSAREDGMKAESWWLELMDEVDGRFRMLPPTDVEWRD